MQDLAMPSTAVEPIQVRYTESPVPLTPGTPKEERQILIDFCELYGRNIDDRKGDGDCFFHNAPSAINTIIHRRGPVCPPWLRG